MKALKKWIALFGTQFLGVLNDNYLKNLIVFIAVLWVGEEQKELVISIATAALVLPFILFSPLAGRLSILYKKQKVVEVAKVAEVPIMLLASFSFYFDNIHLVIFSLFLMGVQSAIYSPAKYGLIKDVGGVTGVSFGSGVMELLTFVGVLLGTLIAGFVSEIILYKNEWVAFGLLGFAVTGWLFSRKIKVVEQLDEVKTTDSLLPLKFVWDLFKWSKNIKGLNFTILGLASFWLIASLLQMSVIAHLPEVYNLSNKGTSIVMAALAVGIGLGCYIAGLISKGRVEIGMVPVGGLGMTVCLLLLGYAQLSLQGFVVTLVLAAFFSGFFKVPLNAWIQQRVASSALAKVLAYNNNVVFLFILISAAVFGLLTMQFDTFVVFQVTGYLAGLITLVVLLRIPAMLVRFIFFITASLIYKIKVNGTKNLKGVKGALLISNHISLLDAFVIVASIPRNVRFVMLKEVYENPWFHWLFKRLNMIPVPGKKTPEALEEFNKICQQEINSGHVVCIFPEGQLSRNGHIQGFRKGIEHIAKGIDAPILPMHMEGLNHSVFTFGLGTGKVIMPKLKFKRRGIHVNLGKPRYDQPNSFQLRLETQKLYAETVSKKLFSKQLSKDDLLRESLRNVLYMRGDVDVLNLLPQDTLSCSIENALGKYLNFAKVKTAQTKTVLIKYTSLDDLSIFKDVEKVFVEGKLAPSTKHELNKMGCLVYESFVLKSGEIISVNTPDVISYDVNGREIVQKGTNETSIGRPLPGVAVKLIDNDVEVVVPNISGELYVLPVGAKEWISTEVKASIDEEGFIKLEENEEGF